MRMQRKWLATAKLNHIVMTDVNKTLFSQPFKWLSRFGIVDAVMKAGSQDMLT